MGDAKQIRPLSGPSAEVLKRALQVLEAELGAEAVGKIRALVDSGELMDPERVAAALEPVEGDGAD